MSDTLQRSPAPPVPPPAPRPALPIIDAAATPPATAPAVCKNSRREKFRRAPFNITKLLPPEMTLTV
ncbi:MAG TPA: hypothetical protein VHM90_12340 [Phycisphaerae bacterium]|nr:hypothetical protein [Phycisphaerae bacterium]